MSHVWFFHFMNSLYKAEGFKIYTNTGFIACVKKSTLKLNSWFTII
jgi:hypothetical protein